MTDLPKIYEIRRAYINGLYAEALELLNTHAHEIESGTSDSIRELIQKKITPNNEDTLSKEINKTIKTSLHSTIQRKNKSQQNITFGIKTNFSQPAKTIATIFSIYAQCIDIENYEIILVGSRKAAFLHSLPNLKFIDNEKNASQGKLGAMMNTICMNASFDLIVSMDDDILLLDSWIDWVYEHLTNINYNNNSQQVFTFPIKNIDGTRFWDTAYSTPHSGSILTNVYGVVKRAHEQESQYVTGGMCLLNKNIWNNFKWDDEKGFYQQEDVEWSHRLTKNCISLEHIPNAYVLHNDWRYHQKGSKVVKEKKFTNYPRNPEKRNQPSRYSKYSTLQEEPGIWPTPLGKGIKGLRDKYKGERCFIIGNGPSLNLCDLSLLKNEYTFGVNSIYLLQEKGFKPTFYVVEDKAVMHDNHKEINAYDNVIKILPSDYYEYIDKKEDIYWFRMNHGYYQGSSPSHRVPRFSVDADDVVYCGQTVTYVNMQIAFYLGFSEIYLIGMDFHYVVPPTTDINGSVYLSQGDDPNHFDKRYFGKGKTWHNPRLDRVKNSYQFADLVTSEFGVNIYNATIGGKLDVFKRANFFEVLEIAPKRTHQEILNNKNKFLLNNPQVKSQIERGDFSFEEYAIKYGIYHEK
jgi:GT2 family glycosyltransferase|tara:strand:- start:1329 stop:3224 length:1896 start_codon:yes stop_codon:yes gene_type:complete